MSLLKCLKSAQLNLIDIHGIADLTDGAKEDLLKILHLQTRDGSWQKGIDATVTAWSFTPIGFLWKPLMWKIWRKKLDALYLRWAYEHYCKQSVCDVSNKQPNTNAKILT